MADGQQSIYFDSTYTLRVVEEDKFKDTERLNEECMQFTTSECFDIARACGHAPVSVGNSIAPPGTYGMRRCSASGLESSLQ